MLVFYSCTQQLSGIIPCLYYETWHKKPLECATRLKVWQEKICQNMSHRYIILYLSFASLKLWQKQRIWDELYRLASQEDYWTVALCPCVPLANGFEKA